MIGLNIVGWLGALAALAVGPDSHRRAHEAAALAQRGDPAAGKALFQSAALKCNACHTTDGTGNTLGPDLSGVGGKFDRPHLVESVLEPSRQVVEGYRTTTLALADGRTASGVVKTEDADWLTLALPAGGAAVVPKADIESRRLEAVSPMPEGLADALTPAQFADLVAYLETLRGGAMTKFGGELTGPPELPAGFALSVVATGLDAATALCVAPDGRLFVAEQTGKLRVVKGGKLLAEPFAAFPVDTLWERGLVGVTVHPDFPRTPFVYVVYTAKEPYPHHVVSRLTAAGDGMVPGSEVKLLVGDDQRQYRLKTPGAHQGGAIHFGPDGKLYVAVGELTAETPSQDRTLMYGKVLRLNPDGTAPADNPFAGEPGVAKYVWAYGLRNPYTMAFQPGTGRLWACDVGASKWDEVNAISKGGNYGWPLSEGPTADSRFVGPVHHYKAASIIGAAFSPAESPWPLAWRGRFYFMDFNQGWVRTLDPEKPGEPVPFARNVRRPVDLRFAADGTLYVLVRDAWVSDGKLKRQSGSVLAVRYAGGK